MRYSSICISFFQFFFSCWPLLQQQRIESSWCYNASTRGLKINFKVHGIIMCLSRNFKTHTVRYLRKYGRSDIETWQIDRILHKTIFYGKIMQKMCTWTQTPFKFGKSPKQPIQVRLFCRFDLLKGIIKTSSNLQFYLLPWTKSLFKNAIRKSKRGLELVTSLFSGSQIC